YTQDQIQAFVDFQDAHQVRRAYLAETAEIAYAGRGPNGEWGHGLGGLASAAVVSLVGSNLIPLYAFIGPTAVIIIFSLFLVGVIRLVATLIIRVITIIRVRGFGLWVLAAIWGTAFQIALTPLRWANDTARDIADRVTTTMETRAAQEMEEGEERRAAASFSLYSEAAKLMANATRATPALERRGRSPSPSGSRM
ncbi:MAG: hypothetical protein AN484_26885, partial [Aphanizomenon flos-aquae WA102]